MEFPKIIMSDRAYEFTKWFQGIFLPALATFYLGLGSIWEGIINFPYPEQVTATITGFCLFLGTILRIAEAQYDKNNDTD